MSDSRPVFPGSSPGNPTNNESEKMSPQTYMDDFFLSIQKSHPASDTFYLTAEPYDDDPLEGTKSVRLKFSTKNLRKLYNELTIYFAERDLLLPREAGHVII